MAKNKLFDALQNLKIDEGTADVGRLITQEIKKASYVIKDGHGRKAKYWWNDELTKIFSLEVATRKKCNAFPTPNYFEDAGNAYERWKMAVKEEKKVSFSVNSIDVQVPRTPGGLYEMFRRVL